MTVQVGMVTSTLDHGLSGPNRVLLNICKEINRRELADFEFKYIHNRYSNLSIYSPSNEIIVPRTPVIFEQNLSNLGLDIIYYPHFPKLRPGFFFLDAKKIVHLHGDLPYAIPSLMSASAKYKQYAIAAFYRWSGLSKKVDCYFAASESLIQNKMRELGVSKDKFVRTEYAPAISIRKSTEQEIERTLEKFDITSRYMLDVASNSKRKNVKRLVDATASLQNKDIDVPLLVIAGDWEGTEIHQYAKRKLGADVIFTGYIRDEEMNHLYNGAEFYVNPTRHEAFGLTNVEAMAAGLPVITSNRFAVPEVVGDAALLIDNPKDIEEIANAIKLLIEKPKRRSELAKKSIKRAEKYTWEKTADKMISVFRDCS